jgi:hypothetical protein
VNYIGGNFCIPVLVLLSTCKQTFCNVVIIDMMVLSRT